MSSTRRACAHSWAESAAVPPSGNAVASAAYRVRRVAVAMGTSTSRSGSTSGYVSRSHAAWVRAGSPYQATAVSARAAGARSGRSRTAAHISVRFGRRVASGDRAAGWSIVAASIVGRSVVVGSGRLGTAGAGSGVVGSGVDGSAGGSAVAALLGAAFLPAATFLAGAAFLPGAVLLVGAAFLAGTADSAGAAFLATLALARPRFPGSASTGAIFAGAVVLAG